MIDKDLFPDEYRAIEQLKERSRLFEQARRKKREQRLDAVEQARRRLDEERDG